MDKTRGLWDDIYRSARKSEKLKFESNERDEGELERTGQPVCIYEIYDGAGAWPLLHHGSLYRGLSLVNFLQPYFELIFFVFRKLSLLPFSTCTHFLFVLVAFWDIRFLFLFILFIKLACIHYFLDIIGRVYEFFATGLVSCFLK